MISILSNIIVLGIFIKYKELRTPTNAIIINLAVTDIGVSSIGYPMSAASDLYGSWKFGYAGCQVYAGLNIFFGMASIGLLTVVAVDRYLTICLPDIVMFYCYYRVTLSIKHHTTSDCTESLNRDWSDQIDVTKISFFHMSVIMICMFLVAWSPYSIVCLWASFGDPKKIPPAMAIIAPLFAKSSTFYNPCIYVVANKKKMDSSSSLQGHELISSDNAPVILTAEMTAWDQVLFIWAESDVQVTLVLCNDMDMNELPTNLPVDTVKLRIEKTVIRRISAEAFYYLVELQYLWVTYNSVASIDPSSFYNLKQLHELRLDGNSLAAFPWASLLDMPLLRTLDLHNNRITSVPNDALKYLKNLAYLDLSSNRLTTLPPDFLESWSHLATTPSGGLDLSPSRVILELPN
ncbi:hypothetical protein P7K49_006731 [Saguinus oedipus]|uniref:G-protein coupled receptors family 1 profile domain-containing protein n=1 Tax=Saguinus oedipus TaxID=9490 RepID=A0ABQ9W3A5_SAGOE|nr:hypothetical protein P7K49_006731 [Saguinus oedipus]